MKSNPTCSQQGCQPRIWTVSSKLSQFKFVLAVFFIPFQTWLCWCWRSTRRPSGPTWRCRTRSQLTKTSQSYLQQLMARMQIQVHHSWAWWNRYDDLQIASWQEPVTLNGLNELLNSLEFLWLNFHSSTVGIRKLTCPDFEWSTFVQFSNGSISLDHFK